MIETSTSQSAGSPSRAKLKSIAASLPMTEAPVWAAMKDGWRSLYGGIHESGVSIESHDFELTSNLDWSRSFHPDSLELCLNVEGTGTVAAGRTTLDLKPMTAGFYWQGNPGLKAERRAGERHRFVTIEFSRPFLRERLLSSEGALHPLVERFVRGDLRSSGLSHSRVLTPDQDRSIAQILLPTPPLAARNLWYQSQVLQLMVDFFFQRPEEDELFCDRQKRTARDRVERVVTLLRQRLAEPPSLEEIGREVGCSPFYLSRTFSREMGMTLPQFLRKVRMERAAELLRSGQYNVTEAAMEVGYSSLSHFSQAFCQTMGCCPALYPQVKLGSKKS